MPFQKKVERVLLAAGFVAQVTLLVMPETRLSSIHATSAAGIVGAGADGMTQELGTRANRSNHASPSYTVSMIPPMERFSSPSCMAGMSMRVQTPPAGRFPCASRLDSPPAGACPPPAPFQPAAGSYHLIWTSRGIAQELS